jgi:hypothetical protein
MEISASGRRMLSDVKVYREFTDYMPATYEARGLHQEAQRSRANVRTMRVLHRIFWVPSRSWDPVNGRYSLKQLFSEQKSRVLPYASS